MNRIISTAGRGLLHRITRTSGRRILLFFGVFVWTGALAQAPPEVTGLTFSPDKITFEWHPAATAAAYYVYRAPAGPAAGAAPVFSFLLCTGRTQAEDTALPPAGTAFFYLISAVDDDGDEGPLHFASSGAPTIPITSGTLAACPRRAVFGGGGVDPADHENRGFFAIYDAAGAVVRDGTTSGVSSLVAPKITAADTEDGVSVVAGKGIALLAGDRRPEGWFAAYGQSSALITSSVAFAAATGTPYLVPATDADTDGGLIGVGGAGTDPAALWRTGWWALYDNTGTLIRSHTTPGFPLVVPFEVHDVAVGEGVAVFAGQGFANSAGIYVPEGGFVIYDAAGNVLETSADLVFSAGYAFLPPVRRVAIGGGLIAMCGDGYAPRSDQREAWFALYDTTGNLITTNLSLPGGPVFEKCDDASAGGGLAAFGLTGVAIIGGLERPEGAFYVYDAAGTIIADTAGFKSASGYVLLPVVTDVDTDGGFALVGGAFTDPADQIGKGFYGLYDALGTLLRHSLAPGFAVSYPPEVFAVDVEAGLAVVGGRGRALLGDCAAGNCPVPEGFFAVYQSATGALVTWSAPYASGAGFTLLPPVTDVDAEGERVAVGGQHHDPLTDDPTGFFALLSDTGAVVLDSTSPGMPLLVVPRILEVDVNAGLFSVGGWGRAILSPGGSTYETPEGWYALYDSQTGGLINWSGPYQTSVGIPLLPPVTTLDADIAGDAVQPQQWVDGQLYNQFSVEPRTVVSGGFASDPQGNPLVVYDEGGGLLVDGFQPQFTGLTVPVGATHGLIIGRTVNDTDRGYTVVGGLWRPSVGANENGFFVIYDPYGRVVTTWREYMDKRGLAQLPLVTTVDVDDDRVLVAGAWLNPITSVQEGFFVVYDLRGNIIVDSADPDLLVVPSPFPQILMSDTHRGWSAVAGTYTDPGGSAAMFWLGYDRWGNLFADSASYAAIYTGGADVLGFPTDIAVEADGSRVRMAVAGFAGNPLAPPDVTGVAVLYHCSGTVLYTAVGPGFKTSDLDIGESVTMLGIDTWVATGQFTPSFRLLDSCGATCADATSMPQLGVYLNAETVDLDVDDGRAVIGGRGLFEYPDVDPEGNPITVLNDDGWYALFDSTAPAAGCPQLTATPAPTPVFFTPWVDAVDTENMLTVMSGTQGAGFMPGGVPAAPGSFWGLWDPSGSLAFGTGIINPRPPVAPDPRIAACELDDDRAMFAAAGGSARLYDWSGALLGTLTPPPGAACANIGVDDHGAVCWDFPFFQYARAEDGSPVADDTEYAAWRPDIVGPGPAFIVDRADTDEEGDQHHRQYVGVEDRDSDE